MRHKYLNKIKYLCLINYLFVTIKLKKKKKKKKKKLYCVVNKYN